MAVGIAAKSFKLQSWKVPEWLTYKWIAPERLKFTNIDLFTCYVDHQHQQYQYLKVNFSN